VGVITLRRWEAGIVLKVPWRVGHRYQHWRRVRFDGGDLSWKLDGEIHGVDGVCTEGTAAARRGEEALVGWRQGARGTESHGRVCH
jgi:hypothetical protein